MHHRRGVLDCDERSAVSVPPGRATAYLSRRHPGADAVHDAVLDDRMHTLWGFAMTGPGLVILMVASLVMIAISSNASFRR